MKNLEILKRASEELDAVVNGWAYIRDDGEIKYTEDVPVPKDAEAYGLVDWLSDEALDLEYTLFSDGDLKSVKIYISLGGPTIFVSTGSRSVTLHWGTESIRYPLSPEVVDALCGLSAEELEARRC